MAKFSLHDFTMKTIKKMIGAGEDDYKVMQYSMRYYEKCVLTEEDLADVESLIDAKYAVPDYDIDDSEI